MGTIEYTTQQFYETTDERMLVIEYRYTYDEYGRLIAVEPVYHKDFEDSRLWEQ